MHHAQRTHRQVVIENLHRATQRGRLLLQDCSGFHDDLLAGMCAQTGMNV